MFTLAAILASFLGAGALFALAEWLTAEPEGMAEDPD
jgi:hypothetical protein